MPRVTFDSEIRYVSSEYHADVPFVDRDASDRRRLETRFVPDPKSELDRVQDVLEKCKKHPVTVIVGNLGRQPHLLTYFLDFCFDARETVYASSDRIDVETTSYAYANQPCDTLFLLEPYFGYTIVKPPDVGKLIVLTSHASFNVSKCPIFQLHLGLKKLPRVVDDDETVPAFRPSTHHDGTRVPDGPRVCLDVSDSESSHEAFLKLLTGLEAAHDRRVAVRTTERDAKVMDTQLKRTMKRLETLDGGKELGKWVTDVQKAISKRTFIERWVRN